MKEKEEDIDPRFLDPSGWRPYPLQLATPLNAKGVNPEKWLAAQPLCTPSALAAWLAVHGKK